MIAQMLRDNRFNRSPVVRRGSASSGRDPERSVNRRSTELCRRAAVVPLSSYCEADTGRRNRITARCVSRSRSVIEAADRFVSDTRNSGANFTVPRIVWRLAH